MAMAISSWKKETKKHNTVNYCKLLARRFRVWEGSTRPSTLKLTKTIKHRSTRLWKTMKTPQTVSMFCTWSVFEGF